MTEDLRENITAADHWFVDTRIASPTPISDAAAHVLMDRPASERLAHILIEHGVVDVTATRAGDAFVDTNDRYPWALATALALEGARA